MYGIDISKWNGNIDLAPYKGQFVIIRAGFGMENVDEKATRNMDECERLGIPYGVYWYSYAISPAQAKAEAEFCLKCIKGRDIKVGVWFDMEDADGYKAKRGSLNRQLITDMCNAFCEHIELAGYYAGIYSSKAWFESYINCPKYDKWVASWGSDNGTLQTDTSSLGSMQQYTSKPLDKNVMYVPIETYNVQHNAQTFVQAGGPEIKPVDELAEEVIAGKWGDGDNRRKALSDAGYDYFNVQARVNQLIGETKAEPQYYTIQSGDCLTIIAKKFGSSVNDLVRWNNIKVPNLIYSGQRIRVK